MIETPLVTENKSKSTNSLNIYIKKIPLYILLSQSYFHLLFFNFILYFLDYILTHKQQEIFRHYTVSNEVPPPTPISWGSERVCDPGGEGNICLLWGLGTTGNSRHAQQPTAVMHNNQQPSCTTTNSRHAQ
jgi:hypothetical protein